MDSETSYIIESQTILGRTSTSGYTTPQPTDELTQTTIDFDPNLIELRQMIVKTSKSHQFPSQFTNTDALYSNDVNRRLFTNTPTGCMNVYTWMNVFSTSIDFMKAKLEYPYNPWIKSFTTTLNTMNIREESGGRIFGYITPHVKGTYSFQISYVGSIELWLSTDDLPSNAVKIDTKSDTQQREYTVNLSSGQKQYIEIIHANPEGGSLSILWKEIASSDYRPIEVECLMSFVNDSMIVVPETVHDSPLPLHAPSSETVSILHPFDERNELFNRFQTNPTLSKILNAFPACNYKLSYTESETRIQLNKLSLINRYPATTLHSTDVASVVLNAVIRESVIETIVSKFLDGLIIVYPQIHSHRLVNMEKIDDRVNGDLILVQMLIKTLLDPSTEHLISHYVVHNPRDPQSQLCHPTHLRIESSTFVHILVTHRNLPQMVRAFVHNMEQIYVESGDENFGVIIVNYVNPMIDVTTLLRQSKLKHWSVIDVVGPWTKTGAYNLGIDSVKNSNDIIFLTDLFLYMPAHLPDSIRTHTFQGFSGFAPILFYMYGGFTGKLGFYSTGGYGPFSFFKSDWAKLGGLNSAKFHEKWGGEDIALAEHVLSNGYAIFRYVIQDSYHQPHASVSLWQYA